MAATTNEKKALLRTMLDDPDFGNQGIESFLVRRGNIRAPAYQAPAPGSFVDGPGLNVAFFKRNLKADPLLSELCVRACNSGLFSGNFDAHFVPHMVQVLCYIRYAEAKTLPGTNNERYAAVHALAAAELLAFQMPETSLLTRVKSHEAIISAISYMVQAWDDLPFGDYQVWVCAEIGEEVSTWEKIQALARGMTMTINIALTLLEIVARSLTYDAQFLIPASFITTVVTALCKQGNLTSGNQKKIIMGVQQDMKLTGINVPIVSCRAIYNAIGGYITPANAGESFQKLQGLFPVGAVRLGTIVTQASRSGATTYYVIKRAMTTYVDFFWARLAMIVPADFEAYSLAAAEVGDNEYYGFSKDLKLAAAKNFKSLAFTAFNLCITLDGDSALENYGGRPEEVPGKNSIIVLIREYLKFRRGTTKDLLAGPVNKEIVNRIYESMNTEIRVPDDPPPRPQNNPFGGPVLPPIDAGIDPDNDMNQQD